MLDLVAKAGPRALTPDVPLEVRKEMGRSPRFERFRKAAEYCARLRHAAMRRQQVAIAQDTERTEFKSVNGLGELHMRITQEEYFTMRAKYGEDCWDDPEFIEAYRRDNPYCRVKVSRGTKGQELRK